MCFCGQVGSDLGFRRWTLVSSTKDKDMCHLQTVGGGPAVDKEIRKVLISGQVRSRDGVVLTASVLGSPGHREACG